ncbi:MAG: TlpA family protein disulfide reductase [Gemmatimonadaceae bacterium]
MTSVVGWTSRNLSLTLVVLGLSLAGSQTASAQDLGILVGSQAPAAVVETLEGKAVDLASYIGKTPVFIEFWATWCPNCKELEPALRAVHKKYGGKVRFLGVAVSVNQAPARVKLYAAKHKLPGIMLFDKRGNAADAYEVPATSYIVVVNKAGKVVYTGLGGDQDLEAAIRKAL